MTDEQVDLLAQTMCAAYWQDNVAPGDVPIWSLLSPITKGQWRRAARAGLRKLSGPDRRMKMSEHTPGPWDGAGDFSIGRMIEGRYEWSAVAHVSERPDRDAPPGEGVANARLIAAAPDLLEALVKLVAIYDDEFGIVAPEMNAAIAAIAKATTTP